MLFTIWNVEKKITFTYSYSRRGIGKKPSFIREVGKNNEI